LDVLDVGLRLVMLDVGLRLVVLGLVVLRLVALHLGLVMLDLRLGRVLLDLGLVVFRLALRLGVLLGFGAGLVLRGLLGLGLRVGLVLLGFDRGLVDRRGLVLHILRRRGGGQLVGDRAQKMIDLFRVVAG